MAGVQPTCSKLANRYLARFGVCLLGLIGNCQCFYVVVFDDLTRSAPTKPQIAQLHVHLQVIWSPKRFFLILICISLDKL